MTIIWNCYIIVIITSKNWLHILKMDSDQITQQLKQKGVRPSYQRIRVLQYLHDRAGHPNAEEIYEALLPEIPTLSRTTVYNTLHVFASFGLVNCLSIDGVDTRYDGMLEKHGHFQCHQCGMIYNFKTDPDRIETPGLEKFKIENKNIIFTGICANCINKYK